MQWCNLSLKTVVKHPKYHKKTSTKLTVLIWLHICIYRVRGKFFLHVYMFKRTLFMHIWNTYIKQLQSIHYWNKYLNCIITHCCYSPVHGLWEKLAKFGYNYNTFSPQHGPLKSRASQILCSILLISRYEYVLKVAHNFGFP